MIFRKIILFIEIILFLPVSPIMWICFYIDKETRMSLKEFYKGYFKLPNEEE